VLDPQDRLLLFRFQAAGCDPFWATVGGALDAGESYAAAARRELFEEIGLVADIGDEVAQRHAEFITLEGEPVTADERYFLVRTTDRTISRDGHTELERRVMGEHRWWTRDELAVFSETVFPVDIVAMLDAVLSAGDA